MLCASATPAWCPAQCECAQYPGAGSTVVHMVLIKPLVEDSRVTTGKVWPLVSSLCFLCNLLLNECYMFQVVSGATLTERLKHNKPVCIQIISPQLWPVEKRNIATAKLCHLFHHLYHPRSLPSGLKPAVLSGELASWAKTVLLSTWRYRNTAWL